MKVFRVQNEADRIEYQALTERWLGIRYPMDYLETSKVYLARDERGCPVGGYCLRLKPPYRVLESLPAPSTPLTGKTVELTGLWFQPDDPRPNGRVRFWARLCGSLLRHAYKNVVFAYSLSKPGLAKTYANARPTVLFSGVTKMQPGMTTPEAEVVCVAQAYRIALLPVLRPKFFLRRLCPRRQRVS